MVSRRPNFGERSEPAPDRGGKLQSAGGGAAQSKVSPLRWGAQSNASRLPANGVEMCKTRPLQDKS